MNDIFKIFKETIHAGIKENLKEDGVVAPIIFYMTERKTHPSECGWDVSDH